MAPSTSANFPWYDPNQDLLLPPSLNLSNPGTGEVNGMNAEVAKVHLPPYPMSLSAVPYHTGELLGYGWAWQILGSKHGKFTSTARGVPQRKAMYLVVTRRPPPDPSRFRLACRESSALPGSVKGTGVWSLPSPARSLLSAKPAADARISVLKRGTLTVNSGAPIEQPHNWSL